MIIYSYKVKVSTSISEVFREKLPIETLKSIKSLTDDKLKENFYRRGASSVFINERTIENI